MLEHPFILAIFGATLFMLLLNLETYKHTKHLKDIEKKKKLKANKDSKKA